MLGLAFIREKPIVDGGHSDFSRDRWDFREKCLRDWVELLGVRLAPVASESKVLPACSDLSCRGVVGSGP